MRVHRVRFVHLDALLFLQQYVCALNAVFDFVAGQFTQNNQSPLGRICSLGYGSLCDGGGGGGGTNALPLLWLLLTPLELVLAPELSSIRARFDAVVVMCCADGEAAGAGCINISAFRSFRRQ